MITADYGLGFDCPWKLSSSLRNYMIAVLRSRGATYDVAVDIVQDVSLRFSQKWDTITPKARTGYLYRSCINGLIDHRRGKGREVLAGTGYNVGANVGVILDPFDVEDESAAEQNRITELHALIDSTKARSDDKAAVRLFAEGYTAKEVANELGITVPAVKTRLYRFREKMCSKT